MSENSLDNFVEWVRVDEKSLDGSGVSVDKAKLYRLKRWQDKSSENKYSYNFGFARDLISKYCGALGVPKEVYGESVSVYEASAEQGLLRGRSVEVLVACSIYVACRIVRVAYTVDEVAICVGVGKKELSKLYRVVRNELGLKLDLVRPVDYVSRYKSVLMLSDDVEVRVNEILALAEDNGLSNGRSPLGLVGGAVYLACVECGDKRSQRDVGDVIGVSEVTIRKRCSELEEMVGL
jgi:transcription initiation factor TFIIB